MSFTIPSMLRMVFISMYTIVDGIVVSNYVGSVGLSAINIVYPILNLNMAFALMFASGANAMIGKKLGEGDVHSANRIMTAVVILNMAILAVLETVFFCFDEQIYYFLGSDDILLPYCVEYGSVLILAGPIWALQMLFQNFLITADRPKLSLYLSIGSGILNVALDLLLVGVLDMGIVGAAYASVTGMALGGLIPLFVFSNRKNLLHFEKPLWDGKIILKSMGNGASEMVSNLSCATTTTLYNWQMMALIGEKGIAAISAALYLQFVFVAACFGFSGGISPLISYNYGAQNHENLRKAYKIGLYTMIVLPFLLCILAEILTVPLTMVFASKDPVLSEIMIHGFRLMALSVCTTGIAIYASAFFTALNDGKVSAIISFLRTFLFEAGAIMLLPLIFEADGVWLALPAAGLLSIFVSIFFLIKKRDVYKY